MNENTSHDKIDAELTKTYFGSYKKDKSNKNYTWPKRKGHTKVIFIFFFVLCVIAAVTFYLFSVKDVKSLSDLESLFNLKPVISRIEEAVTNVTSKPAAVRVPAKGEKVFYNFEIDEDSWEIPAWELDKPDHVARTLEQTKEMASNGRGSLKLYAEFPGIRWTGALVEIQQFLDLRGYDVISCDIYLPPEAPQGLRAKIILTVGETWKFVEMSRSVRLVPGEWTEITAKLTEDSMDWKRTQVDDAFKEDVRKVSIRVESNKPAYSGPIYIDNIRAYSLEE